MRQHPLAAIVLGAAFGLALAGEVAAATRLQYLVEGECTADFTRMSFAGLRARVDHQPDGDPSSAMTTLFDDDEQLVYLLMHDSRSVMTMESDDDAVDFQSDVGRSVTLHARNTTAALTGISQDDAIAQAQAMQEAICPEMAGIGLADPDYADAAARCAETMQAQLRRDPQALHQRMSARGGGAGGGTRSRSRSLRTQAAHSAAPPPPARTTRVEAGGVETVDGIQCQLRTTLRGDIVLREECRAPLDALGLDAGPMRRLARIARVGHGMTAGIRQLYPELDDPDRGEDLVLQRRCFRDGRATGSATLRIERDVQLPADEFAVPAGYVPFSPDLPDGAAAFPLPAD